MISQKRPAFLLDGIQTAHQGGVKQYDSKKDKYLKDFNQNLLKKQNDKGTSRFHTESNRQPNNSSIISLNQSIQLHQRPSIRKNQLNRVYTQNQYPDKSTSPNIQSRLQNTPKNRREGGLSLPKLDSTNSNLQKPVTREQLLQFLDQIMFAVENVQYIVSQYENPPSEIYQSQPVRQMAKFKITQEQQTDHSYIQSLIKNKQQYINKVNKKTQTPNKQMRANSQNYEQPILNKKTNKIKTEYTEESDGTEKRPTRFPNIVQSSQKQKVDKLLPQNRKNRVQSQIISYTANNQKENEQIQKENTNKQISNNETQQNSDQSNIIYESSQYNEMQTNIDLKNKRNITPSNQTYLIETQKKQQKSSPKSATQLQKTNQNAMIIQQQNKQDGNQSIQQISSNRYSLSDFEDGDQDILLSRSSLQDQQISQKKQVNAQKTPKMKKRPIQIKNSNQNETNQKDNHNQFDQKTIELRQNTNDQLSKPNQIQNNSNEGDYEFSNEFLSEQTKQLTKISSNTQNKQQLNKLSQKQNSSKKILQINPDAEFYLEDSQKQDKQCNKQNDQHQDSYQNHQEQDQKPQSNEKINKTDKNVDLIQNQKLSNDNQQIEPSINNQNDQKQSQVCEKSIKNQEQLEIQVIKNDVSQNKEELLKSQDQRSQSLLEQSLVNSIVKSIYVKPNDLVYQKSNHQSDALLVKNEEQQSQSRQQNNQQVTQQEHSQNTQIIDKLSNQQFNVKSNEDLGESKLINEDQLQNPENKSEKQDKFSKTDFKDNITQSHQIKQTQTGIKFQPKSLQQSGAYQIIFDKDKYVNQEKQKIIDVEKDKKKQNHLSIDQSKKINLTQKSLQIIGSNQDENNQKKNFKSQILNGNEEVDEQFIQSLSKAKKNDQNNQKQDEVKNEDLRSNKISMQISTEIIQQQQQQQQERENESQKNNNQNKEDKVTNVDQKSQQSKNNDSLKQSQIQNQDQIDQVQINGDKNNKIKNESILQQQIQEENNSEIKVPKVIDLN